MNFKCVYHNWEADSGYCKECLEGSNHLKWTSEPTKENHYQSRNGTYSNGYIMSYNLLEDMKPEWDKIAKAIEEDFKNFK